MKRRFHQKPLSNRRPPSPPGKGQGEGGPGVSNRFLIVHCWGGTGLVRLPVANRRWRMNPCPTSPLSNPTEPAQCRHAAPPRTVRRWQGLALRRRHLLRLYRLGVVVAIVADSSTPPRPRAASTATRRFAWRKFIRFSPPPPGLDPIHPSAEACSCSTRNGQRIGYVLRTSPISDKITGYAGRTDTLVALDADDR